MSGTCLCQIQLISCETYCPGINPGPLRFLLFLINAFGRRIIYTAISETFDPSRFSLPLFSPIALLRSMTLDLNDKDLTLPRPTGRPSSAMGPRTTLPSFRSQFGQMGNGSVSSHSAQSSVPARRPSPGPRFPVIPSQPAQRPASAFGLSQKSNGSANTFTANKSTVSRSDHVLVVETVS